MIGIFFKIEDGKIDYKVSQVLIIVGDCWLVHGGLLLSLAFEIFYSKFFKAYSGTWNILWEILTLSST